VKSQQICSLSGFSLLIYIVTTVIINFFANTIVVRAQNLQLPRIAKVIGINQGDLACYVDLVDDNGRKYEGIYAIFEICEKPESFLKKKVKLSYREETFNDCESDQPCGKTKLITAITEMQLVQTSIGM
jgi:hypothetical protein